MMGVRSGSDNSLRSGSGFSDPLTTASPPSPHPLDPKENNSSTVIPELSLSTCRRFLVKTRVQSMACFAMIQDLSNSA